MKMKGWRVMAVAGLGIAAAAVWLAPAAHAQTPLPGEISAALAALPAEPYFTDMALAFGATSEAVIVRTAALVAARSALARVSAGFAVVAEAEPTVEFERDLADPADKGAWQTDIDLSVAANWRRDAQALARARLAVTNAEARLRDQLRDDLQRSLLALSSRRLAERGLADAELEAARAEAALSEAVAAAAPADQLLALRVAAELAANAVERERYALAEAVDAAAGLGLTSAVPLTDALLGGATAAVVDLAPGALAELGVTLPTPEEHVAARALALELALAVVQADATPFNVLREIELYGAYETSGFELEGRAALAGGVPVLGSTLSWTNGADDVGFVVGIGATLRLTDQTAVQAAAAARAVSTAQGAYASFLDGQVASELAARRAAELEFEDFALTRLQLLSSEAQLERARADGASEREVQRLGTALRRAQDAGERAWQRYVRSLVGYLGVADAMWRNTVMEDR